MFKQFLLVAAIVSLTLATSTKAHRGYALERSASAESRSVSLHSDTAQLTEALLDDIVTWLSSNFDLPAIKQRPVVEFASKMELARLRARDRTSSQGFMESDGQLAQREVSHFTTTRRERSCFLMIGAALRRPTNRSWYTKWSITFRMLESSNLIALRRERSWPTWLRING